MTEEHHLDSALPECENADPREGVEDRLSRARGAEQQVERLAHTSLHRVSVERALRAHGREVERHHGHI